MISSGIYKIQSKVKPCRMYIGSSVNIERRWRVHLCHLRHNRHDNFKLQHHYNKYGEDDLVFSVLVVCDGNELTPIDKIVRPEQFFIWAYDPWFNICEIAGNRAGHEKSLETLRKISEKLRGNIPWNKGKKGLQEGWSKGKTKESDASVKKISEAMCGKKHALGFKHSEETKEKWRIIAQNRPPQSDEQKKRNSESHKGKAPWNKGIKMGPQSEEFRKKRGAAIKKAKALKKQLKNAA